jgi:hypothetical protein
MRFGILLSGPYPGGFDPTHPTQMYEYICQQAQTVSS